MRRGAGWVPLALLGMLALAVIVVPAVASRDPLRIDDVLARRLVAPFGHDAQVRGTCSAPTASGETCSCA
jgi:hypothetical protein